LSISLIDLAVWNPAGGSPSILSLESVDKAYQDAVQTVGI